MNDAAQHIPTTHRTTGCLTRWRDRNLLIKTLMRARGIEELNVFEPDPSQVGLVDDQYLVQAFFPY
jgi:hypothetical protein